MMQYDADLELMYHFQNVVVRVLPHYAKREELLTERDKFTFFKIILMFWG